MKVWVWCPSLRCLRFLEPKGQLNPIKPLNHGLDNLSMSNIKWSLKKPSSQIVFWGLVAGKMAASVVRVWPMKRPTCPWCWILTGGTLRMVSLGMGFCTCCMVDCTWGESTNMCFFWEHRIDIDTVDDVTWNKDQSPLSNHVCPMHWDPTCWLRSIGSPKWFTKRYLQHSATMLIYRYPKFTKHVEGCLQLLPTSSNQNHRILPDFDVVSPWALGRSPAPVIISLNWTNIAPLVPGVADFGAKLRAVESMVHWR